jgi:hypothetical protein
MKTPIAPGKWFIVLSIVVLGLAGCATATAQAQTNKLRVGVYDSRAVAVAWGNSAEFKAVMKPIEAEFKQAKEAKDEKRAKEIDDQMKLRQRRAHEQAFSTGSVAPIMGTVQAHLPGVAKQAGVQIIVSKWELNHQSVEIEVVDVTDKIVALFHVSERGLKWCQEIPKTKPLSIDQITEHLD